MLWFVTAAAGVLAGADGARTPFAGGASAEELLARALEVIEQQSVRIDDLARQNAELREQNVQLAGASEELRELVGGQAAQLAEANATIAVLQRIVFGRSSEKSGPAPDGDGDGDDAGAGDGGKPGSGKKKQVKRGPGGRSGRRDYSGLPRFEVFWDFPGGGYCCPDCGQPFTLLGDWSAPASLEALMSANWCPVYQTPVLYSRFPRTFSAAYRRCKNGYAPRYTSAPSLPWRPSHHQPLANRHGDR